MDCLRAIFPESGQARQHDGTPFAQAVSVHPRSPYGELTGLEAVASLVD